MYTAGSAVASIVVDVFGKAYVLLIMMENTLMMTIMMFKMRTLRH